MQFYALGEIGCDTRVQGSVSFAGKNIDVRFTHTKQDIPLPETA